MFNRKNTWTQLGLLSTAVLLNPVAIFADNAAPAAAAPTAAECTQDILLSFFPESFVKESLESHKIPQDKWAAILSGLKAKDQALVTDVEAKAAKMNPNPLKDPDQRAAAMKLFRDTMQESFTSVFKENGVTDEKEVLTILDEIQEKRAVRFETCVKAGFKPSLPAKPAK